MPNKPDPSPSISPLYLRYFTADEKRSLRIVPADDLSSEINLLRILARLYMQTQQSAPRDLASSMQALYTCTMLCEQLGVLVRTHNRLHGSHSLRDEILDEALASISPFLDDRTD
jgi:hypothetical protein